MAIQITGRLISWLASRGHLGDSVDYWRGRLRAPGPRGGKHKGTKVAQVVYIGEWVPEAGVLLEGFRDALGATPCRLAFNSVNLAKRAVCELEALRRSSEYAEDNATESLRGGTSSTPDSPGA